MHKTTLYLPEELEAEIELSARALGISKAEFMRQAIERLTAETKSVRRRRRREYSVLPSGTGTLTVEEMDEAIYQSMKRRASKR